MHCTSMEVGVVAVAVEVPVVVGEGEGALCECGSRTNYSAISTSCMLRV